MSKLLPSFEKSIIFCFVCLIGCDPKNSPTKESISTSISIENPERQHSSGPKDPSSSTKALSSSPKDPFIAFQEEIEKRIVPDTSPEGLGSRPGSKIIRRTFREYAESFPFRRLVLFSGHKGKHSGTFGTTQGPENYMIDSNEWGEVEPDMVSNVHAAEMAYIPSNMIDEIVVDDARFFPDDKMANFLRMLKKGGRIIFHPGFGMGWPALNFVDDQIIIGGSGRRAEAPLATKLKIDQKGTPENIQFIKDAMAKADFYYKNIGFSKVNFDEDHRVFILTK